MAFLALGAALAVTAAIPPAGMAAAPKLWTEQGPKPTPSTVPAPDWVAIVTAVRAAVVNITTDVDLEAGRVPPDDLGESPARPDLPEGLTVSASGFIINPDGFVVTNHHAVDGAQEIRVTLADGRVFTATVVGADPATDIALLRVAAGRLPTIPLGDSDAIRPGEPVMAIGSPFGLEESVTTGVVSATRRVIGIGPYNDFIQTDASINPGNSGGPLIDARGRAVGINTGIVTATGGSIGIGFAIPINVAKVVLPQLVQHGRVDRGWLGVSVRPVTPDRARPANGSRADGALVSEVVAGSPAAATGVRPGDIVIEYDGRRIGRITDLARLVAATPAGTTVRLKVVRGGVTLVLAPTIARLEESGGATARPPSGVRS
jgi:serine protease Do